MIYKILDNYDLVGYIKYPGDTTNFKMDLTKIYKDYCEAVGRTSVTGHEFMNYLIKDIGFIKVEVETTNIEY